MNELQLPRLIGTRPTVQGLFTELDPIDPHQDSSLVLICRNLATVSASAVDEIVKQALSVYRYKALILVSPPPTFEERIRAAAKQRGFEGAVRVETALALGI